MHNSYQTKRSASFSNHQSQTAVWLELFLTFFGLGCTSFGGPIAHLGYFRAVFVEKKRWLDEAQYLEMLALCQCLPGPTSSQVGMSIGYQRAGIPGAIIAWLGFTLPSAFIMIALGLGLLTLASDQFLATLQGLALVAVIVVFKAVISMGKNYCTDVTRILFAASAFFIALIVPGFIGQLLIIGLFGFAGYVWLPQPDYSPSKPHINTRIGTKHRQISIILSVVSILMLLGPMIMPLTESSLLQQAHGFFKTGFLVFGGGHVVLPLLDEQFVTTGAISREFFLAGYSLAQIIPGPLFTFAGYIGAALGPDLHLWRGILCLIAIFVPSFFMLAALLPLWAQVRQVHWINSIISGISAAMVGLLAAAWVTPLTSSTIRSWFDFLLLITCFLVSHRVTQKLQTTKLGARAAHTPIILIIVVLVISFSVSVVGSLLNPAVAKKPTTVLPASQSQSSWYQAGQKTLEEQPFFAGQLKSAPPTARNIIIFVGDGMGISTVTAARMLQGQKLGLLGEEHQLSFEKMSFTALSKTYNVDAQTPDSAGTMTAMMTGVKTDAGVLGVTEDVIRGDCKTLAGQELTTALELAELAGQSTGIVTTTRITHATPAATYAKSVERNWEDNTQMPIEAIAAGCQDIAVQLVNFKQTLQKRFPTAKNINGIDVVLGGGRQHFLPTTMKGQRTDQRNLIQEWHATYPTGHFVRDSESLLALKPNKNEPVFGLFQDSHMNYATQRDPKEPSLTQMTAKAIQILNQNQKGYFLMVEAGRIDHGHHAGNAYSALHDTIEFANAIESTLAKVDLSETLVVVTADHSHVFTIAGYPRRGNPILGKVIGHNEQHSLASDGLPYTTLGYANGPGAHTHHKKPVARPDLTGIDTTLPGFQQQALVPLGSETHGAEDVVIYGEGPGAHNIMGTLEQNVIYHILNHAGELEKNASKAL